MRRIVGTMLPWALALLTAPALGQALPGPAVSPGNPPPGGPSQVPATVKPPNDPLAEQKLNQILARWEADSAQIGSLFAEFDHVEKLVLVGTQKRYRGMAFLQRPNLALIELKRQVGEEYKFDKRIVCTGREVVEYSAAATQITVFPLPKDAQLRALDEGPLPFLFGLKAEEIKRRYQMTLKQEAEKSYRIEIEPLLPIDRDAFAVAVLDLNKETLLPDALYMLSANGQDQQHYYFTRILKNRPFQENTFHWSPELAQDLRQQGWSIIVNPSPDEVDVQHLPGGVPSPGPGPGANPNPAVGRTPAPGGPAR
ncbi:hypothetical protein BH23PLA1_BH23PLA1_41870 [soil metagenome]